MKNIILVDQFVGGHHLSYIKIYYELFVEIGFNVVIVTLDAVNVKKYLEQFDCQQNKNLIICELKKRKTSEYKKNLFKRDGLRADLFKAYYAFRDFRDVRNVINANNIKGQSQIFFLWFDTYLTKRLPAFWVDHVLPYDFAGLYFHPSRVMARAPNGHVARDVPFACPTLNCKKLRFVGVFDEKIARRLAEIHRREIFDTLPDIAEIYPPRLDDPLVAKILDSANGRKIIVLVGALDKRKNLLTFIRAAKESNGTVFFVCVGKLYSEWFSDKELDEIARTCNTYKDKLYFYGEYIESDSTFDSVISVSTVLFAAYDNFTSSSNMLYKAALHKKPIIVSGDHLMGEQVRKYKIGLALADVKPQSVLSAITNLLENKASYGFDRFLESNSREKLKELITKRIC